ncbi:cytochrome C oxidase subunit II [Falsibacillus albus]|uniref:Cytochrome C oxidase subunit II n=1 Tax=Falsibacillus albus TaxID=2478915 RepID=A0A3L7K5X0_9BACI|nr:cytochrome C oxidase subunit II [Falsibacillus albus]RLQ96102.1 cytochrome C oxidase subunit II [Falsibacillus albus]
MKKHQDKSEVNLKGTLISVFAVGFLITAMWVSVYALYLGR